jgi:hypothetical protein
MMRHLRTRAGELQCNVAPPKKMHVFSTFQLSMTF